MRVKIYKFAKIPLMGASILSFTISFTSLAFAYDKITAENWTEKAGFLPDLSHVPKPGETIGKWNADKVAHLIPKGIMQMIKKYELRLKIREYERIHPSQGYINATNKYRDKARIIDIGKAYRKRGLTGHVAGLPFPNPKNGLEVAWNFAYNYGGDDGDVLYDVIWVSAATGIEHIEYWRLAYITRGMSRTDIEPIPYIKQFKDQDIQSTSITWAIAPYDKKGFGAVYTRSQKPLDLQGHIYVPSMRRVLRNTFGTRGDTWNATDLLYEDVRGYTGYPEWMYWKLLGKKTILMPLHAGVKYTKNHSRVFETEKWPHWNPKIKWEPRPMYVLEVKPKMPDYPYQKMLIYIDAETFTIPYKEAYDKKGTLWKTVLFASNGSADMHTLPPKGACALIVDLQAQHATLFNYRKIRFNIGFNPQMFTLSTLRRRGR